MATTKTTPLQTAAAELADAFTTNRPIINGDSCVILRPSAAAWIKEAVHTAHGDLFPDDYVYATCQRVADSIVERLDDGTELGALEDDRGEIVDGLVDVYTADLTAWAASNVNRVGYMAEARSEYGDPDPDRADSAFAIGQYFEIESIFGALLAAIDARATELEA